MGRIRRGFLVPALPSSGFPPYGGLITGANTQTGANPLGIAPVTDAQSTGFTVSAASVITFLQTGDYVVSCQGGGTVMSAFVSTAGAGVTEITALEVFNGGATMVATQALLRVTSLVGATYTLSLTATTVTNFSVGIGQAPSNSLN